MIDLLGISIDGETSKDLDDAVWVVDEGERPRLWISIAAVSNSVSPLSKEMQQAMVWLKGCVAHRFCGTTAFSASPK